MEETSSTPSSSRRKKKQPQGKIPCPFCGVWQSTFPWHIQRQHAAEPRVKEILDKADGYENVKEKIAYRRRAFCALAYEGRASHNEALLKEPGRTLADLVPSRRVGKITRHFKKCPNCLGLFKRLRRHKCPKKKRGQTPAQLMAQATNLSAAELLPPDLEISKTLMGILSALRDGDVKALICQDRLLLHWADNEAKKHIMADEESSTEDEEESVKSHQA